MTLLLAFPAVSSEFSQIHFFCILVGTRIGKLSNYRYLPSIRFLSYPSFDDATASSQSKQFTLGVKCSIQFCSSKLDPGNFMVSSINDRFHLPFPGKWFCRTRSRCETFSILTTIFCMVYQYRGVIPGLAVAHAVARRTRTRASTYM